MTINPIYISTSFIQTDSIIEAVRQLSSITKNIELTGGCLYEKNLLDSLITLKQKEEINFLIHNYFPPPQSHSILNFADRSKASRDFIKKSMQYIDTLGIPYYSIHAGFKKTFELNNELLFESGDKKEFFIENVIDGIEWFSKTFSKQKIALENLHPNNNSRECCFLVHIDEIIYVMNKAADIYLLLDLGHLKISSTFLGFNYQEAAALLFEKYGHRILEVHLSENNGYDDDHLLIHSDSIQPIILKEYADIIKNNKINITIESRNSSIQELSECLSLIIKAVS